MRQVLGRFFALRGRTYKYYAHTVDSTLPDPMLELSQTAMDTAVVLTRAPSGVRQWISQATVGLCDEAKKRIATEIAAHCLDGLSALEGSGLTREAAAAQVLEGLGDPVQANGAFHKTYLTSRQERYMARVMTVGQTQYQVLYEVIVVSCFWVVAESAVTVARAFGLFNVDMFLFTSALLISPLHLLQTSRGRFNDKVEQRHLDRVRRPLERKTTWLLFVLFACLYARLEMQADPKDSLVWLVAVVVPFLYGTLHRSLIRGIVTRLPNMPHARINLMFAYSGLLFSLTVAATAYFIRIVRLGAIESHRPDLYPFCVVFGEALPIVLGLLWFGGHALVGAFFVGKARPVEIVRPATEPGRMGPA